MNWADNEERDHDFGYQFGYLMFKPDGGYPEMERGRFFLAARIPAALCPRI